MRDGNADLVSAAFDAWNRRDLRALLALCEPDVEVRSLMTEAERATYSGSRGVSDWLAAVIDVFPDWQPVAGRVDDYGDARGLLPRERDRQGERHPDRPGPLARGAALGGAAAALLGLFRTEEIARAAAGVQGYGRPISSTR